MHCRIWGRLDDGHGCSFCGGHGPVGGHRQGRNRSHRCGLAVECHVVIVLLVFVRGGWVFPVIFGICWWITDFFSGCRLVTDFSSGCGLITDFFIAVGHWFILTVQPDLGVLNGIERHCPELSDCLVKLRDCLFRPRGIRGLIGVNGRTVRLWLMTELIRVAGGCVWRSLLCNLVTLRLGVLDGLVQSRVSHGVWLPEIIKHSLWLLSNRATDLSRILPVTPWCGAGREPWRILWHPGDGPDPRTQSPLGWGTQAGWILPGGQVRERVRPIFSLRLDRQGLAEPYCFPRDLPDMRADSPEYPGFGGGGPRTPHQRAAKGVIVGWVGRCSIVHFRCGVMWLADLMKVVGRLDEVMLMADLMNPQGR